MMSQICLHFQFLIHATVMELGMNSDSIFPMITSLLINIHVCRGEWKTRKVKTYTEKENYNVERVTSSNVSTWRVHHKTVAYSFKFIVISLTLDWSQVHLVLKVTKGTLEKQVQTHIHDLPSNVPRCCVCLCTQSTADMKEYVQSVVCRSCWSSWTEGWTWTSWPTGTSRSASHNISDIISSLRCMRVSFAGIPGLTLSWFLLSGLMGPPGFNGTDGECCPKFLFQKLHRERAKSHR